MINNITIKDINESFHKQGGGIDGRVHKAN